MKFKYSQAISMLLAAWAATCNMTVTAKTSALPPEKTIVIKQENGGPPVTLYLARSFAQGSITPEIGIVAKAPSWEVMYYNKRTQKAFYFPLSNSSTLNNKYLRLDQRKNSNGISSGKWLGLPVLRSVAPYNELAEDNYIADMICPPQKNKGRATYELYYTEALKLSREQQLFISLYFREVARIEPRGIPLAMNIHHNGSNDSWYFRTKTIETRLISPSAILYPQGMARTSTTSSVSYNNAQLKDMQNIGAELKIGEPFGNILKEQKHHK